VNGTVTRYFARRLSGLRHRADPLDGQAAGEPRVVETAAALATVDVSAHNAGGLPPTFETVVSQVVSASQFFHPAFGRFRELMFPGNVGLTQGPSDEPPPPDRKLWEWCYILRAAEQHGKLVPGAKAIGFGVGSEPLPAALAKFGLSVLATDRAPEASADWAVAGQHMQDLRSLSKSDVVSDDVLQRLVTTRHIDMNSIPNDLGRFDLVWSACALEHLGTPQAGLDFVVRTLDLLRPHGLAVHTTELELTRRGDTADYGHLAVYRTSDLDDLVARIRNAGFETTTNWYVSMDTAVDRFVSTPPHDRPHLKLTIGESVSTSVGLIVRRPT
jgi:Methyltransferase domain